MVRLRACLQHINIMYDIKYKTVLYSSNNAVNAISESWSVILHWQINTHANTNVCALQKQKSLPAIHSPLFTNVVANELSSGCVSLLHYHLSLKHCGRSSDSFSPEIDFLFDCVFYATFSHTVRLKFVWNIIQILDFFLSLPLVIYCSLIT